MAQKKLCAKLQLIYPESIIYKTLLVKNSEGKVLSEMERTKKEGKSVDTYLMYVDSPTQSSFSIFFGGSLSKVSDTLYFIGHGMEMRIEIGDSFALRDQIKLKLRNVYNFEELYERYIEDCNIQTQNYYSLVKRNPNYNLSEQQYAIEAKLDFVKKNVSNPYAIDLFSFFVIGTASNLNHDKIYQFYINHLKNKIEDPKIRQLVESKIEVLKQSLEEGNTAPVFSAVSVQNELINSKILLGKNIILTFWATWCNPCITELPYLKEIHQQYKKDNLVIVAVSLDTDSLKMANMICEKEMNWVQIFNNRSIIESYRINPIPATFLIDEKGVIIYNSINRREESGDLHILRLLLKQKFNH